MNSAVIPVALLLSAGLATAQNTLRWTTNYYTVTGASLAELQKSLARSRPWQNGSDLDGLTEWHIEWRYAVTPSPGGCQCTSFTTSAAITVTLPRWMPPTNTSPNLKQTWDRYLTALGQHEAGHAQIALAAVAAQHKRINAIGELPDCDVLKQKIDGLAQRVVEDFRERDEEYDRRTQHGTRQGAFWPGRDGNRGRARD